MLIRALKTPVLAPPTVIPRPPTAIPTATTSAPSAPKVIPRPTTIMPRPPIGGLTPRPAIPSARSTISNPRISILSTAAVGGGQPDHGPSPRSPFTPACSRRERTNGPPTATISAPDPPLIRSPDAHVRVKLLRTWASALLQFVGRETVRYNPAVAGHAPPSNCPPSSRLLLIRPGQTLLPTLTPSPHV